MSIKKQIRNLIKKRLSRISTRFNHRFFQKLVNKNQHLLTGRNKLMHHLEGERILVLAPHVDDETIGCGGAILQYVRNDKNVTIAFLTDSGKRGIAKTGSNVVDTRKNEAIEAGRLLGIPDHQIHYLNGKDGDLANSLELEEIARLIDNTNPDTILLPAPIDTHPDHRAVSILLARWSRKYYEERDKIQDKVTVYLYDVQSPLTQFYSNVTLDISKEKDKKQSLLRVYRSQTNVLEFGSTMDKYYGMLYSIPAAEVYIKVPLSKFLRVTSEHIDMFEQYSKTLLKNENEYTIKRSFKSSIKYKQPLNLYVN